MMNLKEYQERKELLGGWYDRIIEADKLFQADIDALRDSKSNLYAGRFVVAVCGSMNSGKSTLLNALLFEEEVLPSHVTTMTAKISLMEGDTRERIEATLYTPDEFQQVKDACSSDTLAEEELAEARETAGAAGIKEIEILTEPARVLPEEGLQGLGKFAAVCNEGGIFSVYVKLVRLWADRPWLHQVTVADTPGTDDPNPERDRITREWIQQADAVVYVTFAGQAITDSDVKFIDEHLAHIDPRRRIIAVNKCDQQPNTEAIWNHILKIQNSDDLRMNNLLGDDDQIVLVSGLGALISGMQQTGLPLCEDMKWYAGKLSAKGYLEPELHGLEKLRALVEQRIIDIRGSGIIQVHQRRLDSVFERVASRLSQDEDVLRSNIDAVNASNADRANERKKVNDSIASISLHIRNSRIGFQNELDKFHSILDDSIIAISDNVSRRITEIIRTVGNIRNLEGQARWGLQDALYKERIILAKGIRVLVNQMETVLNNAENQLSDTLLASGLGVRVPRVYLLPVSSRTICKDAEDRLIKDLDRDSLNKVVDEATKWWQRIFNTDAGREAAVERLKPELESILGEALRNLPEHTRRELNKLGEEALQSMENSCREILERRRELLDDLEKGDLVDKEQEVQLRKKLRELEKRKLEVQNLQVEYEEDVNA